jgi:hypothetical protein
MPHKKALKNPPVYRYLRGYALDPGFSTRLDTAVINEVVYSVPFESLKPGPIGKYIEVIDVDPPSKCWYEPVDLGAEQIASQNGLAPSEGNPNDSPFRARARTENHLVSAKSDPDRMELCSAPALVSARDS